MSSAGTPFLAKNKKMKWNGRSYRPAKAQFYTKKKPFDFEEALKPYGEKELPVWQSIVAVNVPPAEGPQPTPTPTASITPTPSITPTSTPVTQCYWENLDDLWENDSSNWEQCVGFGTPTPTPTASYTPTPTSTTPPSGTTEAKAYLNAVVTAGGTLSPTISAATITLFTDIVSAGLWDHFKAFYPFLGGTGSSNAINGKNPNQFLINWYGGLTFNSSGVTGNGSTGYGNTGYNQLTNAQIDNEHVAVYLGNGVSNTGYDVGIVDGSTRTGIAAYESGTGTFPMQFSGVGTSVQRAITSGDGYFVVSRNTNTKFESYWNGSKVTFTEPSTGTLVNGPYYLLARNTIGTGPNAYSNRRLQFASFGIDLTTGHVNTLTTIINNFQTSIGRNTF